MSLRLPSLSLVISWLVLLINTWNEMEGVECAERYLWGILHSSASAVGVIGLAFEGQ